MKKLSWLMILTSLVLGIALIGCGGYVKKDELEKQLSDQKMSIDQKIQLAQDSAATANDKAEKALAATKQMDKMKEEILSVVDGKIDSALVTAKTDPQEIKRIAEDAANKAVNEAKSFVLEEDEKIKQMAREAADKAMNAAMEAERKAQEAAREAEIAKTLPKFAEPIKFVVYFDPGKAVIKNEWIAELEKAANAIKDNPNAKVRIEGHADNTPVVYSKYRNNWLLSQARANAVKDYLIEKLGVPADALKDAVGFGEFKPAAPNDKAKKWENRRVEIIITE